ncbi:glycoside hydrolase family 15 protein [Qipengyuania benthica]|uniref:glycoside hydrolase family 15 protein n=1 Tax=Qipengyuania benthica TaxID=3067651 RepID=UPI00273CCC22|nr:glycoside hydrolase family 15 protein [Qipengyuania sp. DY56-A-20]
MRADQVDEGFRPLADYAVIGDMQACALVSKAGSIDWLCLPNIADPALFAGVLGAWGGRFAVGLKGKSTTERCYIGGAPILRTRLIQDTGIVSVTDFLALRTNGLGGTLEPERELIRIVEAESGNPTIEFVYEPRPCFGKDPHLAKRGKTSWACQHEADLILFRTDVADCDSDSRQVAGSEKLQTGDRRYFSLSFCRRDIGVIPVLGEECETKRQAAEQWWSAWLSRSNYSGNFREPVRRSLMALRLLASRETGAVAAAATSSLPEWIGGKRNWDYRYCWMRDAYFVLSAFVRCGLQDEAEAYFNWLMHATQRDKPELRPVYDIFGRSDLPEKEVSHLEGYRNSAPVRIGNGASQQVQLDSYGSVILGARALVEQGGTFGRSEAKRLAGFVETVCGNWQQPDNGIWEMRRGRLHHLYSKAMCWGALDGALWLEERDLLELDRDKVRSNLDTIRAVVLEHGWNEDRQAYTGALDCEHLDASVLLLPKLGIIEADHPRMVATYERIDAELAKGSFVWRYDPSIDDNSSPEGAFMACSFWAAEYLALAGRRDEAAGRMRKLLGAGNDLRIFSEEYDPEAQIMLGNLPQGLSHAALVHAALALGEKNGDEV